MSAQVTFYAEMYNSSFCPSSLYVGLHTISPLSYYNNVTHIAQQLTIKYISRKISTSEVFTLLKNANSHLPHNYSIHYQLDI